MSEKHANTEKIPFLERKTKEELTAQEIKLKIMREILPKFYESCNKEKNFKKNILGRRISEIRQKNGLTQEELAKKCGINRGTIIYVEKGKGKELSNYSTIEKILSVLDCDIYTFISYEENQEEWEKIYRVKNTPISKDVGLDEVPATVELNDLKQKIFQALETDYVFYKKDANDEEVLIPAKYLELLRMEIYNSFETINFLLNNK